MIQLSLAGAVSKVLRLLMEEYPIPTIIVLLISLWLLFFYQITQYGWKEGGKPFLIFLTKWFIAPVLIILILIKTVLFFVNTNSTVFYEKAKVYMKSDANLKQSAFELFTDYIDDNPETDSAYYYRAMCFLDSYQWEKAQGFKEVLDFNSAFNHLPAEYTFKNAISDLRMANSHNSNIQVTNQINSAIFKSIILTLENINPSVVKKATKFNYLEGIPSEELDEFYKNLKSADYKYVPYDALLVWTALSMDNSTQISDEIGIFYMQNFSNQSQFLLKCWNLSMYRVKSDYKRISEFCQGQNLKFKDIINSKYCAVIENGNDTIHIPIDSIGLKNFTDKKLGSIPRQMVVRPK